MRVSLKSYIIGFLLSLIFTLLSYLSVVNHLVTGMVLLAAIFGLAFIQLIVQLLFFLHLGEEKKPYWNSIFFIMTLSLIIIVIAGAVWIMYHLNTNMTPQEIQQYVQSQDTAM